jgi:hypothetical protein
MQKKGRYLDAVEVVVAHVPSAVSMGTVLMSSSFHHHVHNMGITLLDRMTPLSRRLM